MVNFLTCDKGLGYVEECTYPYKIHDKILRSMVQNVCNFSIHTRQCICTNTYIYTCVYKHT